MQNYFYTNAQLGNILQASSNGSIDWDGQGFTVRGVSKAVSSGFQQQGEDNITISMLPIDNEQLFMNSLGNLISDTINQYGEFFKIISEDKAIVERDRLKSANEERHAVEVANAPLTTDQKLDLLMMAQLESEGIL